MKVLLLATGMGIGGAEQQVVYLSFGLQRLGHDVWVCSITMPGFAGNEARSKGVTVKSLGVRRGVPDPRSLCRLIRIICDFNPDILCCFMFHANIIGRLAGFMTSVPVIIASVRNENFGGRAREWMIRLTEWMGDVTTTNSVIAAKALLKRRVISDKRLRVIPNGIAKDRFEVPKKYRESLRADLGVKEEEFFWLAAGRLRDQKDYFTLLEAVKKLSLEKVRVMIAGHGPLEGELSALIKKMSLENTVSLLGFRKDIPLLLAACDGFVLSSAWEGMPNAVMEALAAAKPVVATSVGGIPELVINAESGFLVPPGDPQALALAMLEVMGLPETKREWMGNIGRKHIRDTFSLERIVCLWEDLFYELLKKKTSPEKTGEGTAQDASGYST